MFDKLFSKEEVLIINWRMMPKDLKKEIQKMERFQNDCYLTHCSEMSPSYGDDWSVLSMERIKKYCEDQVGTNRHLTEEKRELYKNSLDAFIKDYGLSVDKWLLDEKIDLNGIRRILIEVCW